MSADISKATWFALACLSFQPCAIGAEATSDNSSQSRFQLHPAETEDKNNKCMFQGANVDYHPRSSFQIAARDVPFYETATKIRLEESRLPYEKRLQSDANRARDFYEKGNIGAAEKLFSSIIDRVGRLGPQQYLSSTLYMEFYYFLLSTGRIKESVVALSTALESSRAAHDPEWVRSLLYTEMGLFHARINEDFPTALNCFKVANRLLEKDLTDNPRMAAAVQGHQLIGFRESAASLGQFGNAIKAGERLIELQIAFNGGQGSESARISLAEIYFANGETAKASELLSALIKSPSERVRIRSLSLYSRALAEQGKLSEAKSFAEDALRLATELSASRTGRAQGYEGQEVGAQDLDAYLLISVSSLASATWKQLAEDGRHTSQSAVSVVFEALQQTISTNAARSIEAASLRRAAEQGGLGLRLREVQDLRLTLTQLRLGVLARLAQGDTRGAKTVEVSYREAVQKLAKAQEALRAADSRFAELISPKALSVDDAKARLAPDEALLLIATTGKDVHTFAITSSQVAWNRAQDSAAETERLVNAVRCSIDAAGCGGLGADAGSVSFAYDDALDLFDLLIKPVLPVIAQKQRLYVVTNGPLASLPLTALPTKELQISGDEDRWFVDRFATTFVPTVSALAPANAGKGQSDTATRAPLLLGYGAPLLGTSENAFTDRSVMRVGLGIRTQRGIIVDPATLRQLPSLPGTKRELELAAKAFGSAASVLNVGDQMTEQKLRSDKSLEEAEVVIIATHGILPGEVNENAEPGLVFTPPSVPSQADDGFLSSSEVSELRLSASLVVLSACNTATYSAGDLSGLARSFLYAGARSVLGSHWRVSDDATAALTSEFIYAQRNFVGLSRAQAFQEAMRAVRVGRRRNGQSVPDWNKDWASPAAWGPFTLIASNDR